jgi:hypothetical protein
MVFGVRVVTVVRLNTALVNLDDGQPVKVEVQQRLWPRCGRATPAAPTV